LIGQNLRQALMNWTTTKRLTPPPRQKMLMRWNPIAILSSPLRHRLKKRRKLNLKRLNLRNLRKNAPHVKDLNVATGGANGSHAWPETSKTIVSATKITPKPLFFWRRHLYL